MGSKCAPSIANIYIFLLEKNFLSIQRPFFYERYVDDIYVILHPNFEINILKNHFDYLTLNIITQSSVNFLDLNITLNKVSGKLEFKLFLKPTNTFSYLLNSSNHPNFIFKNIPKGVLFRARRICTYLYDYFYFSRIFLTEFIKRGFDETLVNKTIRMISNLDRNKIIQYKDKRIAKFDNIKTLFFQLPFNFNYMNIEKFFLNFNLNSSFFSNFLQNCNLRLINKMNPSIARIFIHDFKIIKPCFFKYTKCQKINCSFCKFSDKNAFIKLKDKFYLPILSNSNCNSINLIYVIYCNLCFHYYIGQTKNLKKHFDKHKRNIFKNLIETKKLLH